MDAALHLALVADRAGVVTSVTAERVEVETDAGELDSYRLQKFVRSNQGTCTNQKPIVDEGARVEVGQVLADGPCTENGEMVVAGQFEQAAARQAAAELLGGWTSALPYQRLVMRFSISNRFFLGTPVD